MSIQLHYFDWSKNPLVQAAEWLLSKANSNWLDLSDNLIVLPGRHAADRLLELLVAGAEQQSIVLTPPTFLTAGELPEKLYQPNRPFASSMEQVLAWRSAFDQLSESEITAVFPKPPAEEEFSKWMGLVQTVDQLHRDLASQMCSFRDAREAAESLEMGAEINRWDFLWKLQTKFWKVLEENDLWDKQTARRLAVEKKEITCSNQIVLIGTIDLPLVIRRMIKQLDASTDVLVFCDPQEVELFDEVGCIQISNWIGRSVEIDTDRLAVANKPEDQADIVLQQIAMTDGKYSANQIVVGVPDDRIAPAIESRFAKSGLDCRLVKGVSLRNTEWFRLLTAIGDFVASGEYAHFSSLIRHPVFSQFVDSRVGNRNWIANIDDWFENHLPYDVLESKSTSKDEVVNHVLEIVRQSLKPIIGSGRKSLASWPERFNQVFQILLEKKKVDREEPDDRGWIVAMKKLATVFNDLNLVPESLSRKVRVDEFLDFVFKQIQNSHVPADPSPAKIDLIGWLDLPMDDAPVAILTSFNEGFIPSSDAAHPFLNQAMRRKLGLLDNRRRYARDAYALELLLHSKEFVHLIIGRFSSDDEPLKPSRLALALEGEGLAKRAKLLFEEPHSSSLSESFEKSLSSGKIEVPKPAPLPEPILELRVTDFSRYLACPYRFYLQRVRGLQSWDDLSEEMQGGHFGSLVHNVLEEFAKLPVKDSTDAEEISKFLLGCLHDTAREQFGKKMRPAIQIQIKQAELRLDRFAKLQADHRASGWVIAENEIKGTAQWHTENQTVTVTGRIDRVDEHQETGQLAVWDYKTSDAGKEIQKLYFKNGGWIDLQLPLYRHLLRKAKGSRAKSAQLGIISLPKKLDKVQFQIAKWDSHQFEQADHLIQETIEKIAGEVFWPPSEDIGFDAGIERICQSGVMKVGE